MSVKHRKIENSKFSTLKLVGLFERKQTQMLPPNSSKTRAALINLKFKPTSNGWGKFMSALVSSRVKKPFKD